MIEHIAINAAKTLYLFTIPYIWITWWHTLGCRTRSHILAVLFWCQTVLAPFYTLFAVFYVFDIAYTASVSYLAWGLINALFISTDLMLVRTLSAECGREIR